MYEVNREELRVLPAAPRYLRRNASRAMGGYIVRGLVELITNARDSGYRLFEREKMQAHQLEESPITIEYYGKQTERSRLVIRDQFEGMNASDMEDRLLQYGTPASGFGRGTAVRGLNARGAKDVASLGLLTYESIKGDLLSSCSILGGQYEPPSETSVDQTDRERLGVRTGNGTVVTLTPDTEIRFPQFDRLARDLNRHIEVRYQPEGMPRIPLVLRERKKDRIGRERTLRGFTPDGEPLLSETFSLEEYASYGTEGYLRLLKSPEPLNLGGRSVTRLWKSEAGVLVADGHTAHDIGFFGAEGADDAAARHLYGQLILPQIEELLLEFEQIEKRREEGEDVATPKRNPAQVTDPDRLGLNREHPFIETVIGKIRPILERALAELQDELTPSAQERIGSELRSSLSQLGKKLAEQLEVSEGPEAGDDGYPWGLTFVPGGVRLEGSGSRSVHIYYRSDAGTDDHLTCILEVSGNGATIDDNEVVMSRLEKNPGLYRGKFTVTGREVDTVSLVGATLNGVSATLRVSVRPPNEAAIDLTKDLELSQSVFSCIPGRRKKITCYSDPSICGERIAIEVTNDLLELEKTSAVLTYDETLTVGVADFYVYAEAALESTVLVSLDELEDSAKVIYEPSESVPEVTFEFTDKDEFGPGRRFQWDLDSPNTILIAAKHPTIRRVLGPDLDEDSDEQWPGQNAPQTRAILAEVIAEAYTARRLDRELTVGSLGIGAENLVDPIDYENFRYECFREAYPICHELLTPAFG